MSPTTEEEMQVLARIKAMVSYLGDQSFLATVLTEIWDITKEEIELAKQHNVRIENVSRKKLQETIAALKVQNEELTAQNKALEAFVFRQSAHLKLRETALNDTKTALKKAINERLLQMKLIAAHETEITRLKARLFDCIGG